MEKYLILCIDDDPDDIAMLKEAFQSLHVEYEMVEANNGEEGILALRRLNKAGTVPCLIVLDINMPKMDGREAFNAIRKEEPFSAIPVVIFSTSSSPMDKMFFSRKSVEYFVKPIDFKKLSDVASAFLKICQKGHLSDSDTI
ncbi:MAG: response regulator [Flaviaesturariibacter sp.]|nr:response regulator [Flaviaesturariibacter sp.]